MQVKMCKVTNVFDRSKREIEEFSLEPNTPLLKVIQGNIPSDIGCAVSINGEIIEEQDWDKVYLQPEDSIIIVPLPEGGGGGGKRALGIVGLIALSVFAPGVGLALAGGTAGVLSGLYTVGILFGGAMLINSLMPHPKSPSNVDTELSQSFSWSPATKQQQGAGVPKMYGRNKVYGNVIATHTETNKKKDKQILNALISLGEGPIKGIVDHNPSASFGEVEINGRPVTDFDKVDIEHRQGFLTQDLIRFFDETKASFNPNTLISSDTPIVYTTVNSDFDDLEIDISAPSGIWFLGGEGNLKNYSVEIKIEIEQVGGGAGYELLTQEEFEDKRTSTLTRTFRTVGSNITITRGEQYRIKVTKVTTDQDDTRHGDTIRLAAVREVLNDDFTYPKTALLGLRALATDQLSGSLNVNCICDGKYIRVYNGASWSIEFSDNPAWVLWDILTQPVFEGGSLSALSVCRYDGIDPARLDLDKFYELAQFCDDLVPINRDTPAIKEKRMVFNGIFDESTNLWEAALSVCQVCRATLVWNGRNITVAIDKAADPVQMFSMGNIVKDSYSQTYIPLVDRASELEVHYIDNEKDYKRTTFSIFNADITTSTSKTTLQLKGLTKESEVWRHATHLLNQNAYLKTTIKFQANIDTIALELGDVFLFQHELTSFNDGGRIMAVSGRELTLSEPVAYDPSVSNPSAITPYQIKIRLKDDTILTNYIENIDGNVVTVTSDFPTSPEPDDLYIVGETDNIVKEYRVTDLTQTEEHDITVEAIEYNEILYADDALGALLPNVTYNRDDLSALYVTELSLSEQTAINKDGIILRDIIIEYVIPQTIPWQKAEIYYKIDGEVQWNLHGQTVADLYKMEGVLEDTTYEIKVVTVDIYETRSPFAESPSQQITTGSIDDYKDRLLQVIVDDLHVNNGGDTSTTEWLGSDVNLEWDRLPIPLDPSLYPQSSGNSPSYDDEITTVYDNWIKDYKIDIYTYGGSLRRTVYTTDNFFTYSWEMNAKDGVDAETPSRDLAIDVSVRDIYFRVSEVPAQLTHISNDAPATLTGITDRSISRGYVIEWDLNGEIDTNGYKIWASQSSPVSASDDDDLVWRGNNKQNFAEIFPPTLGTWYYKIAAFDTFGETGLNISAQGSTAVTDLASVSLNYPQQKSDLVWYDDDIENPSQGRICWSEGNISYGGNTYTIDAGCTYDLYVYWDVGDTFFLTTNDLQVVWNNPTAWLMANNDAGEVYQASAGNRIIHGGWIQASSVKASNAIFENGAIQSADIGNAQIKEANIDDLAVTSAKIGNLEVKTANIDDLTVSGDKIQANAITVNDYDFTAGSVTLTTDGVNVTLASCTITATNKPVIITFSCISSIALWDMEIKRGSTSLVNTDSGVAMSVGDNAFTYLDNAPGTGSRTYYVYGARRSGFAQTEIENRSMWVMEVRK